MTKHYVGELRAVHQITHWEICKKIADDPKDEIWIPCEKQAEAEILSAVLKDPKKEEKKKPDDEDD